jgi:hypothetical protein
MKYDQIRIQDFLANRVDLRDFCFVLENRHKPIYSYQNLAGDTPSRKSINMIVIADRRGELGELVFHLVRYWLEHIQGTTHVLIEQGLQHNLALFRDELLERRDHNRAREVSRLLSEIQPVIDSTVSEGQTEQRARTSDIEGSELENKDKPDPERRTVFISYSQEDENQKKELLTHLQVLVYANLIEVWSDDRIDAGSNWKVEISKAINRAQVAILLISANFLTSDFIQQWEVPELLKRRDRGDLIIFPVIAKPCSYRTFTWLSEMQVRPKAGNPIWRGKGSQVDTDLAEIAEEIANMVRTNF